MLPSSIEFTLVDSFHDQRMHLKEFQCKCLKRARCGPTRLVRMKSSHESLSAVSSPMRSSEKSCTFRSMAFTSITIECRADIATQSDICPTRGTRQEAACLSSRAAAQSFRPLKKATNNGNLLTTAETQGFGQLLCPRLSPGWKPQ